MLQTILNLMSTCKEDVEENAFQAICMLVKKTYCIVQNLPQ